MRPYLAVIRDSFREAFATRVLWIVLILIAVFLLAIAPFGYQKTVPVTIRFFDVRDARGFVQELRDSATATDTPAGYVFSRLSADSQRLLNGLSAGSGDRERFRFAFRILDEINDLLREPDFYRDEVWKDVRLNAEGRRLLKRERSSLSEIEVGRLNRLAFDVAFHEHLEPAGREALQFAYLWSTLGDELPVSEVQLAEIAKELLTVVVTLLVGYLGMFVALLVTASMVPQMLEAGAVDLQLSKPVSRSLLLLSKFAGGCAFILLNTSFLVVGLWLIAGCRFGVWNSGLLWTIPVFVFVFAIFYSVSTLAAVLWKNAVVSIVVSVAFWAVCFSVGLVKSQLDTSTLDARRTETILPVGDAVLMTTRRGSAFEWDADAGTWRELFEERRRGAPFQPTRYPFIGPVHDAHGERLIAVRLGGGRGFFRGRPKIAIGTAEENWKLTDGADVPGGTRTLLVSSNGILTAGTGGIHRLAGDSEANAVAVEILGFRLPGFGGGSEFVRIDDETLDWQHPFGAAIHEKSDRIAVLSGDTIAVLEVDSDGRYVVQTQITRESNVSAAIGMTAGLVVLAWSDGRIEVLDARTLETVSEHKPFGNNEPRLIEVSPGGQQIAVLFHHRRLWVYDTTTRSGSAVSVQGQGDISAISFGEDDRLFVADRFGRVIRYNIRDSYEEGARYESAPDFVESIYTQLIRPLHTVFPKPDEMTNVTRWMMTGQETAPVDEGGLNSSRIVIDVWQPLWSNLVFLCAMLTLNCILFSRRDF